MTDQSRTQLPDGYSVRYWHTFTNTTPRGRRIPDFRPHRCTFAFLFDENGEHVSQGVAVCGPYDQFNRRLGRTIALGRALKALRNGGLPLVIEDGQGRRLALEELQKQGGPVEVSVPLPGPTVQIGDVEFVPEYQRERAQ
jgi:hypothetical protein